ncbi:tyrosine-protein kinase SRK2-like [Liolophura sinensis]|uniref:tyrosine-protein kinase SRK2-like n=1 Tax=Liolophura sinensis TaxID=3198878 RepID=UPI00315818CF
MGNRMGKRAKKMSASSPNLSTPTNGDRTKRPLPKINLNDSTPPGTPPLASSTPSNLSTSSSDHPWTTPNISHSTISPAPFTPEPLTKSMLLKSVVVAIYTYESRQNDELTFKRGDRMEVVTDSENYDWWLVKHLRTGAIGYIPRNYVTLESNPVQVEDWWCPLDRGDAERTLLNPDLGRGTFLIRERPDHIYPYALSIKDYSDSKMDYTVKHYKIRTTNNGRFYISHTNVFGSIVELVAFYSENVDSGLCCLLTTPCPKKKPFVPFREMEVSRSHVTLMRKMGDGYFGEVWKGVMAGRGEVAVKMMKMGKMSAQSFIKEAKVLHNLRHPKLVPLRGVCTKSRPMMIITELMGKGDLSKYLQGDIGRRLKTPHLVDMASQIASGMSYLEKCNYIHRDLRAANVLVGENNTVKIADFGLARLVLNEDDIYIMTNQSKVPIKWTAPEALFKREFSIKSDVWSFGVLLYEIFTYGKTPYPGISTANLQSLLHSGYRMQKPKNFPVQVYNIMLQCWQEHPEDRPEFAYLHSVFDDYIICTENSYREREC